MESFENIEVYNLMCGKCEQHISSEDRWPTVHTWHLCEHASTVREDISVPVFFLLTESRRKAMQGMLPDDLPVQFSQNMGKVQHSESEA